MSSNESKTVCVCLPHFDDLDDWEVMTGCQLNRTSIPQLIGLQSYQLVGVISSDLFLTYNKTCTKNLYTHDIVQYSICIRVFNALFNQYSMQQLCEILS